MAKKLVATVHVVDDEGVSQAFGPGDEVPAWAAKQITNPKAWAAEEAEPEEKPAAKRPVAKRPTTE